MRGLEKTLPLADSIAAGIMFNLQAQQCSSGTIYYIVRKRLFEITIFMNQTCCGRVSWVCFY
jgi:hypothetical protein